MADDDKPLLVFPAAVTGEREKLNPPRGEVTTPGRLRQGERLAPAFVRLQEAMAAERAQLTANMADVEPEKVLVLETVGPIDNFMSAVRGIKGLEWLFDTDATLAPSDDFYVPEKRDKPLVGHLYLVMSDSRALEAIIALWRRFQLPGAAFDHGFGPWRKAFDHLHDVRYWSREDRLRETGFGDYLKESLFRDGEAVTFEVDVWYRQTAEARRATSQVLRSVIGSVNGRVLVESVQSAIGYHAMLVEISGERVRRWVEGQDPALLDRDEIMFFRPVGQSVAVPPPIDDEAAPIGADAVRLRERDPVVALLDGMPIENHQILSRGLIVDDPDGWAAEYPVSGRAHGTAMASLILRGDLNAGEEALDRPIYVRPVLRFEAGTDQRTIEVTPRGVLIVDLMFRAVRRLFEASGDEPPAAPTVRIINHSLGDRMRLFDGRLMSPWARALDWLAWHYGVLFLVSGGNHDDQRALDDFDDEVFRMWGIDRARVETAFLRDAHRNRAIRRLRVPAESVNAITVGALHADLSDRQGLARNFDPFVSRGLPSPVNGIGFGYRGGIKPEVMFAGGRLVYTDRHGPRRPPAIVESFTASRGPGQRVAAPSSRGRLDETTHTCGTSNATALATRGAARLFETLTQLRREEGGERLNDRYIPVLLKAMLVHGASWGEAEAILDAALSPEVGAEHWLVRKRAKARLIGHGAVDVSRVMACTERRVTVLGCGELAEGDGHEYRLPIPAGLSRQSGLKRVVVTLGWLTPINTRHQAYRRARLWVKLPTEEDGKRLWHLDARGPDGRDAQRGTVQHCVYESQRASPIPDGQELRIRVNCKADAGELDEVVPYGLAVTLEVAESIPVDIYAVIRQRLRSRVPVRARS